MRGILGTKQLWLYLYYSCSVTHGSCAHSLPHNYILVPLNTTHVHTIYFVYKSFLQQHPSYPLHGGSKDLLSVMFMWLCALMGGILRVNVGCCEKGSMTQSCVLVCNTVGSFVEMKKALMDLNELLGPAGVTHCKLPVKHKPHKLSVPKLPLLK